MLAKVNKNTPRTAVCLYFAIDKPEKISGIYTLFARLLLQGTKTKSAEELAILLENQGIELSSKYKQDYFKIDTLFLKNDADLALDTVCDIILNSTFDDFEKEVFRLKGEIKASLDNLRMRALSEFQGNFFLGHYYGNTSIKTLEMLDKIKKEDVIEVKNQILNSNKIVTVVGDFDDKFLNNVSSKFNFMKSSGINNEIPIVPDVTSDKIVKIAKNDANQAHIIQGWSVPTLNDKDYPKLVLMNNLLGSSGLSSRLFYELRDRLGLAYHVRSGYDVLKKGAVLNFYIATNPKNIKKCLEGFKTEITRLQNELCSIDELNGARENTLGKLAYFMQTNLQQASMSGYDYIMGLDIDFSSKYKAMLENVTREDLTLMAQKYLSNKSVITISAPSSDMENII